MEKLGTLESEVLSHEVVDGRVKVVVRTVPGMKLPRVVRPVLRGKEVEFVDTRTFLQRDKGKLPFAQTFRTVNNITERASVAGTIVIDRAPVPVLQNTEGAMMMGTVIRVQGECVVRIAGLGGKVESVIVQNLRNAYKKLPEIVHEWVATRETRLTEFGFAGGIPGGIQRSPSLSATSVETVVETTNAVTSPRLIRAASVESEGSDLSSASFHSADSFQIENESARDDGREEGWGGRGGDARSAGAASNGSSETNASDPTPGLVAGASHTTSADDTTCAFTKTEPEPPRPGDPPPVGESNRHEPAAWRCAPRTATTAPPVESISDGLTLRRIHAGEYSNDLAPRGVTTGRPPPSLRPAPALSGQPFGVVMVMPTAMNPPAGRPNGGVTHASVDPSVETCDGWTMCGPNWHAMSLVNPAPWKVTRVPPSAGPRFGRRSSA